jgi:dephospho-CoA kinase
MLITFMFIGVTGQIGAGKTTAAKILASFGAVVIDADAIGHQVVEQSARLRQKLVKRFGKEILTGTQRISRKQLAKLAFADDDARQDLNRLVHPYLLKELRSQMRLLSRRNKVVVIDAALLLDWHLDREMDLVLVVHAGRKVRLERLAARGITPEDALARERAQLPLAELKKRADYVLGNNGSVDRLCARLKRIWDEFTAKKIDRKPASDFIH